MLGGCVITVTDIRTDSEKRNTGSQERFLTHVRTIWPGGRQYAGDAATQLAAVYYDYLYLSIVVRLYIICTQTADKPHGEGKKTFNGIYVLLLL